MNFDHPDQAAPDDPDALLRALMRERRRQAALDNLGSTPTRKPEAGPIRSNFDSAVPHDAPPVAVPSAFPPKTRRQMNKDRATTIVGAILAILTALVAWGVPVPAWLTGEPFLTILGTIVAAIIGLFGYKAYKPDSKA